MAGETAAGNCAGSVKYPYTQKLTTAQKASEYRTVMTGLLARRLVCATIVH